MATSKDRTRTKTSSFNARIVFLWLLSNHVLAASLSPIQDCDEVFNFWEPTHYLNHGYGLQTWELSAEFAIRSWLYTAVHALPIYLVSWTPFVMSKTAEYYFLRGLLAVVCAFCEIRLFSVVSKTVSPRVGLFFVLITSSAAGMFHASVSYLPSTFAMYCVMLGTASFLDGQSGTSLAGGIAWFAVGTIVGWPFVAVLVIPFVLWEGIMAFTSENAQGLARRLGDGLLRSLAILALEIIVDSVFYRKLVCVPLNIVWYNVFSSEKGPNIYGTEPWDFYLRNLLINFNLWFLLALLAPILIGAQLLFSAAQGIKLASHQTLAILSPFFVWLVIFTAQPHKEERFMYPVYPLLALNAAVSTHAILLILGSMTSKAVIRYIPASLRLALVSAAILTMTILGIWRSIGLATAYSAPLSLYGDLYKRLSQPELVSITRDRGRSNTSGLVNVCVGKEWYRYPSSYFLPPNARLRFIKSEFAGLLPGEFLETPESGTRLLDPFPGAHVTPAGMNDRNIEDVGKYIPIDECDYLVDSSLPSTQLTRLEPDYVHDKNHWKRVLCYPFLDASRTGVIGRLFWVPEWTVVPRGMRRVWGEYCMLERRERSREKSGLSDRA